MLVEVQDCKGVATQGKLPQKSRKEGRTKAEDIGRSCKERIRGQSAPYVSILSSGSNSYAVLSRCVLSSAWLCLRDAILRTISLPGSCQRLGERASSAHLCSPLTSQILQRSFFLIFFLSSDLDHFKVHTRSAVSVREGQGVVLLCGTPTSSGGELSGPSALIAVEDDFSLN